jgi:flavorubredoxin
MMTFDATERTLFAGDAFGGFGALDGGIFDDEVDIDYFDDEILRYFSNIVGKYCGPVQRALSKLAGVNIKVVAPTHGPVWRKNPGRIVANYDRWSRHEGDDGVVLVYASMYGNTTRMMEAVARGLSSENFTKVRVHDVSRTHVSYIIRDVWRYKAMILGGPTHDVKPFPPLGYLIDLLADKMLKNRIVGIFGTYGWSGGCVRALRGFAEKAQYDIVEPVVEACFSADDEALDQCHQLGRNIARRVRGAE